MRHGQRVFPSSLRARASSAALCVLGAASGVLVVQLASRGKGPRAVRKGKVEVLLKGECDACAST